MLKRVDIFNYFFLNSAGINVFGIEMRGYFFIHDALTLTGEGNPYESAYNLN